MAAQPTFLVTGSVPSASLPLNKESGFKVMQRIATLRPIWQGVLSAVCTVAVGLVLIGVYRLLA